MLRFAIWSIPFVLLGLLASTQLGFLTGEKSSPRTESAVDLMVVNDGAQPTWLEVGWSHDCDHGVIAGQEECGWVDSGMTSFRGKEISSEGTYYLLLYDAPGGTLLDVSRPFHRTDNERLFVDATVSRGTMTIDAY